MYNKGGIVKSIVSLLFSSSLLQNRLLQGVSFMPHSNANINLFFQLFCDFHDAESHKKKDAN